MVDVRLNSWKDVTSCQTTNYVYKWPRILSTAANLLRIIPALKIDLTGAGILVFPSMALDDDFGWDFEDDWPVAAPTPAANDAIIQDCSRLRQTPEDVELAPVGRSTEWHLLAILAAGVAFLAGWAPSWRTAYLSAGTGGGACAKILEISIPCPALLVTFGAAAGALLVIALLCAPAAWRWAVSTVSHSSARDQ